MSKKLSLKLFFDKKYTPYEINAAVTHENHNQCPLQVSDNISISIHLSNQSLSNSFFNKSIILFSSLFIFK